MIIFENKSSIGKLMIDSIVKTLTIIQIQFTFGFKLKEILNDPILQEENFYISIECNDQGDGILYGQHCSSSFSQSLWNDGTTTLIDRNLEEKFDHSYLKNFF